MPQLLRSRAALGAALYGAALGTSFNWSDTAPVARTAEEASILYGGFAPVYAVILAMLAMLVMMTGWGGNASAAAALLVIGVPIPALLAILGGLYAGASRRGGKSDSSR